MRRTALGRLVFALVPLLLLLAACTGGTTETPLDEPTEEDEVGAPAEGAIPESGLSAPLSETSALGPDQAPRPVDTSGLPGEPGSITAYWYRHATQGRYLILFGGLDMTTAGGLCPGSSIDIDGTFRAVNNSPTEEGACPEGYTIDEDAARVCGPLLVYITQIHQDEEGTLYASVDKIADDGGANGLYGSVAADKEAAPAIDIEQDRMVLPESLGGGEVSCAVM